MKNKNIFLILLASSSFSAYSADLGSAVFVGNSVVDKAKAAMAESAAGVATLATEDKTSKMLTPINVQGSYNSKVPGGNPFLFCSGGRPSRGNPLRPIYDSICPDGNTTPEQAMVKSGLTDHIQDARSLGSELTKLGTSDMLGIGVSSAAEKALGSTSNVNGETTQVNNNMSYSQYNKAFYQQLQYEDYLRQQELIKAAEDPEYVPKVIPNSHNYNLDQTNIVKNQMDALNKLNSDTRDAAVKLQQMGINQPNPTTEQMQSMNQLNSLTGNAVEQLKQLGIQPLPQTQQVIINRPNVQAQSLTQLNNSTAEAAKLLQQMGVNQQNINVGAQSNNMVNQYQLMNQLNADTRNAAAQLQQMGVNQQTIQAPAQVPNAVKNTVNSTSNSSGSNSFIGAFR